MKPGSIEALQARLLAIPKEVRDAVKPALVKGAEELQGTMQNLAPVDSGALRNSIEVTLPGQSTPPYSQPGGNRTAGELEVIVTAGNPDVRYAHLAEYENGTPFFWPSWRLRRKRIEARLKRAMRAAARAAFAGEKAKGGDE